MQRFMRYGALLGICLIALLLAYPNTQTKLNKKNSKATIKLRSLERRMLRFERRREARRLTTQIIAAERAARKRCADGSCDWREERWKMVRPELLSLFTRQAASIACPAGTYRCPNDTSSSIAPDCCVTGTQGCNVADPSVGSSGAVCVDNQATCAAPRSYCEATNEKWKGLGDKLTNCCPAGQQCTVAKVTINVLLVSLSANVPICVVNASTCPPETPNGKMFSIDGKKFLVCCKANEKPTTINNAPFCQAVQCPTSQGLYECAGAPMACCKKDVEGCSPGGTKYPANCFPLNVTTTTTLTTTTAPSSSSSPSGSSAPSSSSQGSSSLQ